MDGGSQSCKWNMGYGGGWSILCRCESVDQDLLSNNRLTGQVQASNVEPGIADVDTECRNLHDGLLVVLRQPTKGHHRLMNPKSGADHPIKSDTSRRPD